MGTIWIVAGTRPEIIKLAPVYLELLAVIGRKAKWIATGQHTDLGDQALAAFGIRPHLGLSPHEAAPGGARCAPASIAQMFSAILHQMDAALARHATSRNAPSLVVVQGDTTSAVAAAVAAFSRGVPVAHVEAGLRTFDLARPFPEEGWRSILAQISALHFAPTESAARNLRRCGVPEASIAVTGNTVIDALHRLLKGRAALPAGKRRMVLVTLHRRENWCEAFGEVCNALVRIRDAVPDIEIAFVSHANPALRLIAENRLAGQARISVLAPLDYPDFIDAMRRSVLILSDSGGVQEEAPALGVPVLVLRESTERPESIEAGVAELVGCDPERIYCRAVELLTDRTAYESMARQVNPFGDGRAANRIVSAIAQYGR